MSRAASVALLLAAIGAAGYCEESFPPSPDPALSRLFSSIGMSFAGAGHYDVIVATIPDPVRSRLRLETHRGIESIVQALSEGGYLYRGVRLAWPIAAEAEPRESRLSPACQESGGGDSLTEEDMSRIGVPSRCTTGGVGVLFFQRGRRAREIVVVLVGETPAGGVDEEGLRRALRLRAYLQAPGTLRLLGPTFSGSYSQLVQLLKAALPESTKGFVVSGMTTSPTARAAAAGVMSGLTWLTFGGDHDLSRASINDFAGCGPEEVAHQPCRKIAYLTESQTLFGDDAAGQTIHLYYPRGISRLRPRSRSLFASRWFRRAPEGDQASVAADLAQGALGEDLIPPVAGKQEEDGLIAQLYSIAARIRRERVANVAVIATDVYDTLFLVRFLRQEVPNVRLLLFDTDTLLLTEVLEYPVEGVVSVSRYRVPAPFSSGRSGTGGQMALFPSHNAIGQYCAARFLLDPADAQAPNPPCGPAEWKGVWLQSVSRAGYLPIKAHLAPGEARKPEGGGTPPPVTGLWMVLALGVYVWTLLHWQSVESLRRQVRGRSDSKLFSRTWLKPYRVWLDSAPGLRQTATRLIAAAATLLFVALVLVTWPCLRRGQWDLWTAFALVGIVLEVLVFVGLIWISRAGGGNRQFVLTILPVGIASALLLSLLLEGDQRVHTLARLVVPSSGVSLTAPFLAVLMLLSQHVYAALRRLQFHVRRPEVPRFSFLKHRGQWKLLDQLDAAPGETLWSGVLFGFAGVALGLLAHLVPGMASDQLLESAGFEVLWVFLFGFGLGQLLLSLYRFASLWFLLRRVLELLELSRLRQAFSRLPKIYSWSPVWDVGGLRQSLLMWTRTLDVGHSLVQHKPPDLTPEEDQRMGAVADLLSRQSASLAVHDPKAPDLIGLNHQLRASQEEINAALDPLLSKSWQSRVFSDSAERAGSRHGRELTPFEFFLEEYCAMRCVACVRQAMLHLRSALGLLSLTAALLLVAANLYAFRSRETMEWTVIPALAAAGLYVLMVLYQMERDAVLSRLANTAPGEVDRVHFAVRALKYVGAPGALLVLSQFPELNRALMRWVAPILADLR